MIYDSKQLKRDLNMIVSYRGERKQHGFYTCGVYKDDYVKIIDFFDDPQILVNGSQIDIENLALTSFTGQHILKLAVQIEDISPAACTYAKV